MRLSNLILVISLASLLPGLAFAERLSVPVGKRSTWVNLETGERRVHGQRVRRIEIDTALVRDKCVQAVEGFEGFIRLRHETRDAGWMVRVECMQRLSSTDDRKAARSIDTASRKALESAADMPAGKS